jgi:hypothetical protein
MTDSGTRTHAAQIGLLVTLAVCVAGPADARNQGHHPGACTRTAQLQLNACYSGLYDDFYTHRAACVNETEDRAECRAEAREDRNDAAEECGAQFLARKALCGEIGEARYAPDLDPELFQDPRNPTVTNPYFPLSVGNRWVFEEDGERIEIEVLDETKRMNGDEGFDCIVYRDIVTAEGRLVEDTDDWFGMRTNGDIVYCGEEVKDYEYFKGDDPEAPELVSIDGRFKVGEELAKAGIAFLGTPVVGTTYRQEWDPGNAEDIGKVLSTTYGYGNDPELDEFVPEALAELMCPDDDCVVIRDGSTLEPDAFERKYYARGVGKFLEVKPDDGEFVPIIECNVDPRCSSLPIED